MTTVPGFRHTAHAVAQYDDFQNLPEVRDLVTYEMPDGDQAHLSFIEPRSKDDLRRRAQAFAAWAEVTCGHMGRSPDDMNACLMTVGAAKAHWVAKEAVWGQRAYDLYLDARRRDLCFTRTFVQAHTDRLTPTTEQKGTLRVVRETPEGPVVTGAKAVGTLAPYVDANLCLGGETIEDYFSGAHREAKEKVALYRMGWDMAGSAWGQRHELYERFFFGEHTRHRLMAYEWANKEAAMAMVRRMLTPPPSRFEPSPLPTHYRQSKPTL